MSSKSSPNEPFWALSLEEQVNPLMNLEYLHYTLKGRSLLFSSCYLPFLCRIQPEWFKRKQREKHGYSQSHTNKIAESSKAILT